MSKQENEVIIITEVDLSKVKSYVIFVVEMIIFAPFSKLAHLMYRTYALWIYRNLETTPKKYPEIADLIVYDD
ncbi:MAG: hypothetical protein ACTSVB_08885 [Candidatus Heimdallarchaeaceae archaeon]|uniref:Uncharacterized protein n=1 Tax=Candidatus Heimdallarchaeum endolithica TaxID=2876572 RepID=A0A9Y1BSY8_9ARCH|nr:MAG: hypothetical protein K9W46_04870 [Candidatus Heimdallarchaeum endolithica]